MRERRSRTEAARTAGGRGGAPRWRRVLVALAAVVTLPAVPAVAAPHGGAERAAPPVLNVLEAPYSAPADGVANDTPAIQAAVDDAAGTGGTVLLPAGRTYVASTISLRSEMTLAVEGTLQQASDAAYYPYTPHVGHKITSDDGTTQIDAGFVNLPLVHGDGISDVKVVGSGTIRLAGGPVDAEIIHVTSIGFTGVTDYELADLTIVGSRWWTVRLHDTNRGLVHGMTLHQPGHHLNSDGLSVQNSQDVELRDNVVDTGDDAVVIRSNGPGLSQLKAMRLFGYEHWADSSDPQVTSGIVVEDNELSSTVAHGVALIPWNWGAGTPMRRLEDLGLADVTVRNNALEGRDPIGCWCHVTSDADGIKGFSRSISGQHAPIRDVTVLGNTLSSPRPAADWSFRTLVKATGLTTDVPSELAPGTGQLGWPGDAAYAGSGHLDAPTINGDFETAAGPVHWTAEGDAGVADGESAKSFFPRPARVAAEQAPAEWGRFGSLSGAGGDASLTQGLGLAGADVLGEQGAVYTYSLSAVTGSSGATLYAYDTCTGRPLASEHVVASQARRVELRFPLASTCGNVTLGVKVAAGAGSWAHVDGARLANAVPPYVDDADPEVTYTGSWRTGPLAQPEAFHDQTLHFTNNAGASVTIPWHGGRAQVLAVVQDDYQVGYGRVWVDGVDQGTITWYRPVDQEHQQVVFDTGDLPVGDHTIRLEALGTAPDEPTVMNHFINVDALRVLPYED